MSCVTVGTMVGLESRRETAASRYKELAWWGPHVLGRGCL